MRQRQIPTPVIATRLHNATRGGAVAGLLAAAGLALVAAGCGASALAMAPMGLEAAGVMAGELKQSQSGAFAEQTESGGIAARSAGSQMDYNGERCSELISSQPGVEEIRLDRRGGFDVRQWALGGGPDGRQWRVVYVTGATPDGWQHKPSLAVLDFRPPLLLAMTPGETRYLAYAPAEPISIAESNRGTTAVMTFGAIAGTFQWGGRAYNFSLASKLPCYPTAR